MEYKNKSQLNWSIKFNFKCSKSCFGPAKEGFKICSKCRIEKPIISFGARLNGDIKPDCKVCYTKRIQIWRKKNPKKQKEAEKRQRQNPKTIIYKKQWTNDHREELNEYQRDWCRGNSESRRNSNNLCARKRRALKIGLNENYTSEDEQITFQIFGNQCFKCGKAPKRLAIDHHIALSRSVPLTVDNAVPLCRNCNSRKWKKLPENFYSIEQLEKIKQLFQEALKIKKEQTYCVGSGS